VREMKEEVKEMRGEEQAVTRGFSCDHALETDPSRHMNNFILEDDWWYLLVVLRCHSDTRNMCRLGVSWCGTAPCWEVFRAACSPD